MMPKQAWTVSLIQPVMCFLCLQQAQQERQQATAQALQQGLQSMSLHQHTPQGMQSMDPFAMRTYGNAHTMDANQVRHPSIQVPAHAAAAHVTLDVSQPPDDTRLVQGMANPGSI